MVAARNVGLSLSFDQDTPKEFALIIERRCLKGSSFTPLKPPTSGTAPTRPDSGGCTDRLSGTSFSNKCVRLR
jgi:hypothetical protein